MCGSDVRRAPCSGYCTKAKAVCRRLIINEILVEAAGVELFSVLTARKLLILRMARGAKKAPLPIPLYVYCTKVFSRSHSAKPPKSAVSHTCRHHQRDISPAIPLFQGFQNLRHC